MILLLTVGTIFTSSSYGLISADLAICMSVLSDALVAATISTLSQIATSYSVAFTLQRFIEIVHTTGKYTSFHFTCQLFESALGSPSK